MPLSSTTVSPATDVASFAAGFAAAEGCFVVSGEPNRAGAAMTAAAQLLLVSGSTGTSTNGDRVSPPPLNDEDVGALITGSGVSTSRSFDGVGR